MFWLCWLCDNGPLQLAAATQTLRSRSHAEVKAKHSPPVPLGSTHVLQRFVTPDLYSPGVNSSGSQAVCVCVWTATYKKRENSQKLIVKTTISPILQVRVSLMSLRCVVLHDGTQPDEMGVDGAPFLGPSTTMHFHSSHNFSCNHDPGRAHMAVS